MDKAAKLLRVITAPPVLITAMLIIFYFCGLGIFRSASELVVAIVLLGILPALAYPIQAAVPKLREGGRDTQRKLAFALTLAGYAIGAIVALAGMATREMSLIYFTYFFSVFLLLVVNKCFHEKASGHACSTAGSLVFTAYYLGPAAFIPCALLFVAMAWSSIQLKRHTPKNLATGVLAFVAALLISIVLVMAMAR